MSMFLNLRTLFLLSSQCNVRFPFIGANLIITAAFKHTLSVRLKSSLLFLTKLPILLIFLLISLFPSWYQGMNPGPHLCWSRALLQSYFLQQHALFLSSLHYKPGWKQWTVVMSQPECYPVFKCPPPNKFVCHLSIQPHSGSQDMGRIQPDYLQEHHMNGP